MIAANIPIVRDLSLADFSERVRSDGIGVKVGPFDAHIVAPVDSLLEPLYSMYCDYPLLDLERVFSFHVRLTQRSKFGVFGRPLVRFSVDGRVPHEDMPSEQALAVLEWGINLVVALRSHSLLMLHSAVVERGGLALLLPAMPGDGKTTLCAGLVNRGWRLFSDEFGLIRPGTGELIPIPRPMPLKNESIQVIRTFAPNAVFGPTILNTRKGTVAHVRPPSDSVRRAGETAQAGWIVFPRWEAGAALQIDAIPKADAFMLMASNSFNYEYIGETAFRSVREIVDGSECFELTYSDLEAAAARLTEMADG